MGRRAIKIEISRGDKSQLQRWANSRAISVQQRDRAVMVLESARGTPVPKASLPKGMPLALGRILPGSPVDLGKGIPSD